MKLQIDIATFGISIVGFELAIVYSIMIHFSHDRKTISEKEEAEKKKIAEIRAFLKDKNDEKLKIVLTDYEATNKEVERRENITVLIGSILITASLLVLGNTATSTTMPRFPYALISILLFAFWLFFLHATTKEIDNLTYSRLKNIEQAISQENSQKNTYDFGVHYYIFSKTKNPKDKDKTVWWLVLRRLFWGLAFVLLCLAWLLLSLEG